jgi:hypothetical protein
LDLSPTKVAAYVKGVDRTGEVSATDLAAATRLHCTVDAAELRRADFMVVAVPTQDIRVDLPRIHTHPTRARIPCCHRLERTVGGAVDLLHRLLHPESVTKPGKGNPAGP